MADLDCETAPISGPGYQQETVQCLGAERMSEGQRWTEDECAGYTWCLTQSEKEGDDDIPVSTRLEKMCQQM